MLKVNALELFTELEQGILNIIRALDIYALHVIYDLRNEKPPMPTIDAILKSNNISGFNLIKDVYKHEEIEFLEKNKQFQRLGEQVILATYTAFEVYLIEKFKEYYLFSIKSKNETLAIQTADEITSSFKSLRRIKDKYYEYLRIHLPSFDPDIRIDVSSNFKPKDSWEGLNQVSDVRNDIAHRGKTTRYQIITLLDSWYPFDFVRRWVQSFDANFNMLIYDDFKTSTVKKYEVRMTKNIKK